MHIDRGSIKRFLAHFLGQLFEKGNHLWVGVQALFNNKLELKGLVGFV